MNYTSVSKRREKYPATASHFRRKELPYLMMMMAVVVAVDYW
jgi:hypothetical protein